MITHKGVYYFPTFQVARKYAVQHGYPSDRIIEYVPGWAIQLYRSGPYVGTAKEMAKSTGMFKPHSNPKYKKFQMSEGYYRLDELPKGEFIKRKASAYRVYIKGEYDRGSQRYYVTDLEDISNYMLVSGSTKVFAGFNY